MHEQREDDVSPLSVFYVYADEDEQLRKKLETHLSLLRQQKLIAQWHNRMLTPGTSWATTIDSHLITASVILLLISPDFLNSDYCYGVGMTRALARHAAKDAHVIPILLRPVDWKGAPFAHLHCLPHKARPITKWKNRDEAMAVVAQGIRTVIEQIQSTSILESPSSSSSYPHSAFTAIQQSSVPPFISEEPSHRQMLENVGSISYAAIQGLPDNNASVTNQENKAIQHVEGRSSRSITRRRVISVLIGLGAGLLAIGTGIAVWPHQHSSSQAASFLGKRLLTYRIHQGTIQSIAWSLHGTSIASASSDKKVNVWDPMTGHTLFSFTRHSKTVRSVAWAPDESYVASGGYDNKLMICNEKQFRTFIGPFNLVSNYIDTVAWLDNQYILSAGGIRNTSILAWDKDDARAPKWTYEGHAKEVYSVAVSPNGMYLASGSADTRVMIWDALAHKTTKTPIATCVGHKDAVLQVAWSPDQKQIASASADGTVHIWDALKGGQPILVYTGHKGAILRSVSWSPNGMYIASGGDDSEVHLWNATQGGDIPIFKYRNHNKPIFSVAWSPNGWYIASGSEDETVQIWLANIEQRNGD